MAISTVRAKVNGTWHTLSYDSTSGSYKATITAPGATSYNQPNGYYDVTVEATNDAGTTATANSASLDGLKLYVKEIVAPVITILSPASGAFVNNNKSPVVFTVIDEAGGSGVDVSSISVKQDGNSVPQSSISTTAITNGYSVTYTPASVLSDGVHTVTVNASDNDGNAAEAKSTTYTVDTVPPALNVSSPTNGLIVNVSSIVVKGTTNDSTSSPVSVVLHLNGTSQGDVSVGSDGSFAKTITLREGENTIVVTATDAAGKSSSVTISVTLDTSVPKIESALIAPNPVDAGSTMVISVVIS